MGSCLASQQVGWLGGEVCLGAGDGLEGGRGGVVVKGRRPSRKVVYAGSCISFAVSVHLLPACAGWTCSFHSVASVPATH